MAKQKQNTQPVWRFLFLVYMGLMLWLLFGRGRGWEQDAPYLQILAGNTNLRPFYTIRNYLNIVLHYPNSAYFSHCVINLVGNVVMFMPAGWLLPRIFKPLGKFPIFLLTCLGGILLVETLQLVTLLGSFDVDDLILNLIGIITGFVIWKCQTKK